MVHYLIFDSIRFESIRLGFLFYTSHTVTDINLQIVKQIKLTKHAHATDIHRTTPEWLIDVGDFTL